MRIAELINCLLLASAGLWAAPARAAGARSPTLEVVGQCPTREAVATALAPVVPKADSGAPERTAWVADRGDRFEVLVAGQSAVYLDAARVCDERARTAAVFIALALSPPPLPPLPAPPQLATPRPPPMPAPPESPPSRWAALALALRCDGASSGSAPSSRAGACGGEVAAAAGRRHYGAFLTAAALFPYVVSYAGVEVRQQRFPFAVGGTAGSAIGGAWSVAGDAGVALVPFTLRAQHLGARQTSTRIDVGGRAGLTLISPSFWRRWASYVSLHVEYFPRPYQLEVDPLGSIGSSSRLWIGASFGVALGPRRD